MLVLLPRSHICVPRRQQYASAHHAAKSRPGTVAQCHGCGPADQGPRSRNAVHSHLRSGKGRRRKRDHHKHKAHSGVVNKMAPIPWAGVFFY